MRKILGAIVVAVSAASIAGAWPAGTTPSSDVKPIQTLNQAPCDTPSAQNYGRSSYSTVNGKATSGTWTLHAFALCRDPELKLTVSGQMIHNGSVVKGFAPGGVCTTSLATPTCKSVGGSGTVHIAHMSGVWTGRWTMTVKGPDALEMFVFPGCAYNAKTSTTTCTSQGTVVRIP
jgi:hypothetical protein